MLLIMVGNTASIFTQVYIVFICSCDRPNVQGGFCLPFSRWKSNNQSHCNLQSKSQDEHTSFWFTLLKSCSTKCRHSLCWCSQNTRACTSMLWLRSGQHHISCAFDHDDLHHSCIYYTAECFVAGLFGSHYDLISCLWEQHFSGLNLYWHVLQFNCLAKMTPLLELPSWYDL